MSHTPVPLKAVLVAIQLQRMPDEEVAGSLAELGRLVTTLGYEVVGQTSQRRKSERSPTVFGDGKLKELAKWTEGPGVIGPMVVKKKHKAALKFEANKEEDDDEDAVDDPGQEFGEFEDPTDDSEENFEDEEPPLDSSGSLRDSSGSLRDSSGSLRDSSGSLRDSSSSLRESADVLIVDTELSPSQLRNLESAMGCPVLDRTGVIIEIFSRHARTRAARLQVEIARLTYVAPRLRETGGNEDRGGGGVGGKGSGETSLELDKRKIRDRIKELKGELGSISQEHDVRRARREQEISVALVGYTNAGKSSLMRALTGSEVLVADKLFATLDTTVRLLYPETRPKILISDTVGFIKKLPHDLVASFKSTLDEALNASLLLFVVDASDATFKSQLEVTRSTLAEVGASDIQSLLILNKVDRLTPEALDALRAEFPDAHFMSAKNPQEVAALRLKLVGYFETDMVDADIFIPYSTQGAIGEIRAKMRVLEEAYDENGTLFKVRAHPEAVDRMKTKFGL